MSVDTFDFKGDAYRPSIAKDPNADLDYTFDWTAWLDAVGDALAPGPSPAAYVLTAVGVTIRLAALDGTRKKVTVFLTGGNPVGTNTLTCRVNTLAGRIEDRTMYFTILER